MALSHVNHENIVVVSISGNLALDNTQEAKSYMLEIANLPETQGVVINCQDMGIMDSNGVATIVSVYKTLRGLKKPFALCSMSSKNNQVLQILDLDKILTVCEKEEEALQHCKENVAK